MPARAGRFGQRRAALDAAKVRGRVIGGDSGKLADH
jgi:hypothetical protein